MSTAFSVVERFTSVQGEGYLSGTPAHFLRLAGCNALAQHLTCADWCDTGYSWGGGCQHEMVDFDAVHAALHASNAPLLVITGGEPMLQGEAIDRYLAKYPEPTWGRTVAIETNGTLPRERSDVWYTVSPKPPFYEVAPGPVSEVKLVVDQELLTDYRVSSLMQGLERQCASCAYFVQPIDNDLLLAKYLVQAILPRHPRWRLSLQLHKLMEVR